MSIKLANDQEITIEELPIWMRRSLRGNDYGAIIAIAFSVLMAWFFVVGPNLPRTNTTENYVFLAADYAAAFQEGRLYPRWSAHAVEGYGAPIPHYMPPGAGYLSGMITALFTDDPVMAVRLCYALALVFAGIGMYGLVVRHRGAAAAIVAAMLYITSPYLGLTAPHIIGNLAQTLALGLLPIFLWSVDRILTANYPQDFAFTTLTGAALLLTEPAIAGAGLLVALALVGWHTRFQKQYYPQHTLIAIGLAILLSAFYWLPALGERHLVHWEFMPETTQVYFMTLREFLRPVRQIDPSALIPEIPLSLGYFRLGILVLSVAGVWFLKGRTSIEALFLGLFILSTTIAITFMPNHVWLLGVITLCASVASPAALAFRDRLQEQAQRLVLALVLLLIVGTSTPAWLPPDPGGGFGDISPRSQLIFEQSGYGVAVVPKGHRYPVTINPALSANRNLILGYQQDQAVRFDADDLSADLRISALATATHYTRLQITTRRNVIFTPLVSYFPGWQVRLGNTSLPIWQSLESGLMQAQVPVVDTGILLVRLGATPIRQMGWGMSSVALLGLMVATWLRYRNAVPQYHETRLLTIAETRLLLVVLGFSGLIILFTASPNSRFSVRVQSGIGLRDVNILNNRTNVGISLLGYRLEQPKLRHGERMRLTLYWSALQTIPDDYRVQITLYSERDGTRLQKEIIRYPGGYPPSRWQANRYVIDPHYLEIPPDMPSGSYLVVITLETCATDEVCDPDERPIFFDRQANFEGVNLELPQTITIQP